jgi:Ca2+-binding RTX toxin-like protein
MAVDAKLAGIFSELAYTKPGEIGRIPIPTGWIELAGLSKGYENTDNGAFRVFVREGEPKDAIIAFKGSTSYSDFRSDLTEDGYGVVTGIEERATAAIEELRKQYGEITTVGHSLGGAEAQSLALAHGLNCFVNNSLPVSQQFLNKTANERGVTPEELIVQYRAEYTCVNTIYEGEIATLYYRDLQGLVYLDANPTIVPSNTPLISGVATGASLFSGSAVVPLLTFVGITGNAHRMVYLNQEIEGYVIDPATGRVRPDPNINQDGAIISSPNDEFFTYKYTDGTTYRVENPSYSGPNNESVNHDWTNIWHVPTPGGGYIEVKTNPANGMSERKEFDTNGRLIVDQYFEIQPDNSIKVFTKQNGVVIEEQAVEQHSDGSIFNSRIKNGVVTSTEKTIFSYPGQIDHKETTSYLSNGSWEKATTDATGSVRNSISYAGDPNGFFTEIVKDYDRSGNLFGTTTTYRTESGSINVIADRDINGNRLNVTFEFDSDGNAHVLSVNSINGQPPADSQAAVDALNTAGVTPEQLSNGSVSADGQTAIQTYDAATPSAYQQLKILGGSLNSTLALINSIKSGDPLSIAAGSFNFINYFTRGSIVPINNIATGLNVVASGLNLVNAIENGDTASAIQSGVSLAHTAAQIWQASLQDAATAAAVDGFADAAFDNASALSAGLGKALPYVSIAVDLYRGNYVGAAVAAVSLVVPVVGWIYAAYQIFTALTADDTPPKPWGNGRFVWDGNQLGVQVTGDNGGDQVVRQFLNNIQTSLNQVVQQVGPTVVGLIPERMPALAYDGDKFTVTVTDPVTGRQSVRRYNMQGNNIDAPVGSPEYFVDLGSAFLRDAQLGQAIAPKWEVDTAWKEHQLGNPQAGHTEEQHAAAEGGLAAPVTGTTQHFDPVALDLNGDGQVPIIPREASQVDFDVDNSGYRKTTAWINANDGMLAVDRNLDGYIDTGSELFSNASVNEAHRGTGALSWVDANRDGKLDSTDPIFAALRVWRDVNSDGQALGSELKTLSELGISDINYQLGTFVQNGVHKKLASPNLDADTEGYRVAPVQGGIEIIQQNGSARIIVTQVGDLTPLGIVGGNGTFGSPMAGGDLIHTKQDEMATVPVYDLLRNDNEVGRPHAHLTITGIANAEHGTATLNQNGTIDFTPEAGYEGEAGFNYTLTDVETGAEALGTVIVNITRPNQAPVPVDQRSAQRAVYGWSITVGSSSSDGRSSQTTYTPNGEAIYSPYQTVGGYITRLAPSGLTSITTFEDTGIPVEWFEQQSFPSAGNGLSGQVNPGVKVGDYTVPSTDQVYDHGLDSYRSTRFYHGTPTAFEDPDQGQITPGDPDDTSGFTFRIANAPRYGKVSLDPNTGTYSYTSIRATGLGGTSTAETNVHTKGDPTFNDPFVVEVTDPHGAKSTIVVNATHYGPPPESPSDGGGGKPVVLDMDGNGLHLGNVNDSNVFFDVNGDGYRHRIANAGPNDGFLVFDQDGDGKVSSFAEISFVGYKDGARTDLEGLLAFDTNNDGIFSNLDERWNRFAVWQDANQNGITDAGEMRTLTDLGIASINFQSDGQFQVQNGNVINGMGQYTRTDGSTGVYGDVTLNYSNEILTQDTNGQPVITTVPTGVATSSTFAGTAGKDVIFGDTLSNTTSAGAGDDTVFSGAGNDFIKGEDGNDLIWGNAGDDVISGGTGHDALFGGLGNDLIMGETGNDALHGEDGNDMIFGGLGDDVLSGGSSNDLLSGDIGNDVLIGDTGSDRLVGGDGIDRLYGGSGNDRLDGSEGDDFLDGGAHGDMMLGGLGDDTYVVDSAKDVVIEEINEGTDTVASSVDFVLAANVENLTLLGTADISGGGNDADNFLVGNTGANTLEGSAGNDTLVGGQGVDTLRGGGGDDTFILTGNDGQYDLYNGGAGIDQIRGTATNDTIRLHQFNGGNTVECIDGGAGLNVITGTSGNDDIDLSGTELVNVRWIRAGAGDDRIIGSQGDDIIFGEQGIDVMAGSGGDDTFLLTADDESYNVYSGGDGFDQILGGTGDDTIRLNRFSYDYYYGDNTVERIDGREGMNIVAGTDDADFLNFSYVELANITRIETGAGDDTITGSQGDDFIVGGAGNDYIRGSRREWDQGDGSDTYFFNHGDGLDTIAPPSGGGYRNQDRYDTVRFGDGIAPSDIVLAKQYYDLHITIGDSGEGVILEAWVPYSDGVSDVKSVQFADGTVWDVDQINAMLPADEAIGTSEDDWLSGSNFKDNMVGLDGADTLQGEGGNDVLVGDGGDDTLFGGDDNDVLDAGDGNDSVYGDDGDDQILGGAGDDFLYDGSGNDTLDGGSGNDTYVWSGYDEQDVIVEADNMPGNQDTLVLEWMLPTDITVSRDGQNIIIRRIDANATLTLKDFFVPGGEIEEIHFDDGTIWDAATLVSHIDAVATNHAPTLANAIAGQVTPEKQSWVFAIPADAFADIDAGDQLNYQATLENGDSLPAWLTFDPLSNTFSGAASYGDVGQINLKLTATDQGGLSVTSTFMLDITNVNDTPVVVATVANQSTFEDAPFSFVVPAGTFQDIDAGDSLTLSVKLVDGSALPTWLNFDAATQTFSGTPGNSEVGNLSIKLTATDQSGTTASTNFALTVINVNDAPVVSMIVANQTIQEDAAFRYVVPATTFTDIDVGDHLTLSVKLANGAALPAWLSFDAATQTFNGTPGNSDVGNLAIKLTATDPSGATASTQFDLSVANVNDAPVVSMAVANQSTQEDAAFRYVVPATTFTDVDVGDSLTLTATLANGAGLPAWLSFDAATQTFSGTPGNNEVGNLAIKLTATDQSGATASTQFVLNIANVNDAPVAAMAIANQATLEDAPFSYVIPVNTFTDIDAGDVLALSATLADGTALPSWLSFNAATRTLSGTPGNSQVGYLAIKLTATDQAGATATTNFNLSITNVNDAPVVSVLLADQTVVEDKAFTYVVPANTFADVDVGDISVIDANLEDGSALPDWLSFDPDTLTFSGMPTTLDIGVVHVKVTVTDQGGLSASDVFDLTVNTAPGQKINGTAGNDILTGLSGNDTLNGGAGADTMSGGTGNDKYIVDNVGDVVIEKFNEGTDTVQSSITYALGANVEILQLTGATAINGTGNELNNTLTGNSAANTLNGGAGDDRLNGGAGADKMIGGVGNDTYTVDNASDVVTELANEGTDRVKSYIGYTLGNNVENLTLLGTTAIDGTGNVLANSLTGNNAANRLAGGDGNDILNGSGGNDTLLGEAGDDTLTGGTGADTLIGGIGNDVYVITDGQDTVTELANEGTDRVNAGISYTLGDNIENLTLTGTAENYGIGNALDNVLTGNNAKNYLSGLAGNDAVRGNGANDILQGGLGDDIVSDNGGQNLLDGGAGTDTLTGNAGNEMFLGGQGNDIITTGTGADLIVFNKGDGQDTVKASVGADNSLSLGGGIKYTDLTLSKAGSDLIVGTGTGESIKFTGWYTTTANNKSVVNLQMIAEAMADFDAAGSDTLKDNKVETFNFAGLVNKFDQVRGTNATFSNWAMTNALMDFHLSGSDTAALGGDIAYQYGKTGTLAGLGAASVQTEIGNAQWGVQAQTLKPLSGLQEGQVKLGA